MDFRKGVPQPMPSSASEARADDEEPPDPGRGTIHTLPQSSDRSTTRNPKRRSRPSRGEQLPAVLDAVEVVVIYTQALASKRWDAQDMLADEETALVAAQIADVLKPHAHRVELVPCKNNLAAILAKLDPSRHLIFNLCEGQLGRKGSEAQTARLMRDLGFVFTGASYSALARTSNKWTTKKLLQEAGLPTPAYQIVRKTSGWQLELDAPLMVKPIAEEGSIGITQRSLARSNDEILGLVQEHLKKYRQAVLLEEFIAGREINVALWGNRSASILPIAEIEFTWTDDPLQKFVTYASKWIDDSPEFSGTPGVCPARLSEQDRQTIENASRLTWRHLRLSGYARIDMRLHQGVPYILEVNANPDLAPDAGFFRSVTAAGFSYEAMILHIAQLALDRRR